MATGLERESGFTLFSDEELSEVCGVKRVGNCVEVTCGCTSHRYGDAVGRLRVFANGDLEISCECTPGCTEGFSLSLSDDDDGDDFRFVLFFSYVHVDGL